MGTHVEGVHHACLEQEDHTRHNLRGISGPTRENGGSIQLLFEVRLDGAGGESADRSSRAFIRYGLTKRSPIILDATMEGDTQLTRIPEAPR
jgi:hypothetical protein